jgi:photosystem II stability/assembly factor-like uncharacterized protein
MPPSQRFAALLGIAFAISACAAGHTSTKIAAVDVVTGLAFNPADVSLLKTGAAGLFRLGPSDSALQAITTPASSGLTGLALNPDESSTLYVSGPGVGVLKSTDAGQHWMGADSGLPDGEITALALHSFRRATLYAWVKDTGLYRTEDGGEHWNRMPDQGPPDTQVRSLAHSTLPGSMNTGWLYVATPSGAFLSMDCF